jgi:hypothetical protein
LAAVSWFPSFFRRCVSLAGVVALTCSGPLSAQASGASVESRVEAEGHAEDPTASGIQVSTSSLASLLRDGDVVRVRGLRLRFDRPARLVVDESALLEWAAVQRPEPTYLEIAAESEFVVDVVVDRKKAGNWSLASFGVAHPRLSLDPLVVRHLSGPLPVVLFCGKACSLPLESHATREADAESVADVLRNAAVAEDRSGATRAEPWSALGDAFGGGLANEVFAQAARTIAAFALERATATWSRAVPGADENSTRARITRCDGILVGLGSLHGRIGVDAAPSASRIELSGIEVRPSGGFRASARFEANLAGGTVGAESEDPLELSFARAWLQGRLEASPGRLVWTSSSDAPGRLGLAVKGSHLGGFDFHSECTELAADFSGGAPRLSCRLSSYCFSLADLEGAWLRNAQITGSTLVANERGLELGPVTLECDLDLEGLSDAIRHPVEIAAKVRLLDLVPSSFLWGNFRFHRNRVEVHAFRLGEPDGLVVPLMIRCGIYSDRDRLGLEVDGWQSRLVWRPNGSKRIADFAFYGTLDLSQMVGRRIEDVASAAFVTLDSVRIRPHLRPFRFTFDLEIPTTRIPLPSPGWLLGGSQVTSGAAMVRELGLSAVEGEPDVLRLRMSVLP